LSIQGRNLTATQFDAKPFQPTDIEILIECCGVCGSDVHTITGGWGELKKTPLCVGHEIVGQATRVGDQVKSIKVGDRVGVGAQIWACGKCNVCKDGHENYCPQQVDTYNAPYPKEAGGVMAQGGYANKIRAIEQFVFPIPKEIPSIIAAPMMCAGLTTFAPLKSGGVGPGKKVAIMGIGGLGHFGILWAKALGAEVWALSHSPHKEADARKLGADHYVLTTEDNWWGDLAFTFDFILNAADMTNEFNLADIMSTLKVHGTFHNVGLPDKPLPELKAFDFAANSPRLTGSHIGNKQEMLEMLKLAAEKKITPMIETIQLSEEGCKEAVERVKTNKVHYRFTLTGFDKVFGEKVRYNEEVAGSS
jgi:alcohol dehydrogenase (NADP+)